MQRVSTTVIGLMGEQARACAQVLARAPNIRGGSRQMRSEEESTAEAVSGSHDRSLTAQTTPRPTQQSPFGASGVPAEYLDRELLDLVRVDPAAAASPLG